METFADFAARSFTVKDESFYRNALVALFPFFLLLMRFLGPLRRGARRGLSALLALLLNLGKEPRLRGLLLPAHR